MSEHRITTWCCVDQGTSKIEVVFDKNVFEPHEVCKAHVHLDNARCNVNLNEVRLAIEQDLEVHADGQTYRNLFTLADRHEQGVPANHGSVEKRKLEVDLKSIRYEVPHERKRKGVMKAVSPEDLYMMQNMQPACHGHNVKNEYFLAVRCSYSGCTCCSAQPYARIPLTIVPVFNPQCYGYQQPADFNPQIYQAYNFQF